MLSTEAIALATYTTTFYSPWTDTGDGSAVSGQWFEFLVTNVIGVPNVKLIVQTSPDAVSPADNWTYDGSGGTGSPLINTPGVYSGLFQTDNRYWRAGIIFYANDPSDTVPGSGNSSSSSGQSNQSSSSSGGSAAITLTMGLVPSKRG